MIRINWCLGQTCSSLDRQLLGQSSSSVFSQLPWFESNFHDLYRTAAFLAFFWDTCCTVAGFSRLIFSSMKEKTNATFGLWDGSCSHCKGKKGTLGAGGRQRLRQAKGGTHTDERDLLNYCNQRRPKERYPQLIFFVRESFSRREGNHASLFQKRSSCNIFTIVKWVNFLTGPKRWSIKLDKPSSVFWKLSTFYFECNFSLNISCQ